MPEVVDVAIIGGGIIGVAAAWHLAKRGRKVLICEKGRVAGEQSSRNWGWVRVNGRDDAEVPIAIESLRYWEELSSEIGEEIGFERRGILEFAETESEMAFFERWINVARENNLDTQLLTSEKAAQLFPDARGKWLGAMMTPSDGRAEPFTAVPAIARKAQSLGVSIIENCAVRTIDIENGRVAGVITEKGRVRASAVLCAAGAWSNLFLGNLDVDLPQLALRGTVARTGPAPALFDGAAGAKDIFIRRRRDGGYTIASAFTEHFIGPSSFRYAPRFLAALKSASELSAGLGADPTQARFPRRRWAGDAQTPFEEHRVLNPEPSQDALRRIRKNLSERLPTLANTPIAECWAGMIDATPDVVPVMDEFDQIKGLFVATGFSGHGFGIGPGAGKVMADLIEGRQETHELERFRYRRFFDGSKLTPGPGI
jgi:glycine/D-amino acid oxidase-like deaminating enzyme